MKNQGVDHEQRDAEYKQQNLTLVSIGHEETINLKRKKIMTLIEKSELREVTGINPDQKQRMVDFLQGAVYCWCKNRKNEWFSIRNLMGGDNYYWQGTPLLPLYKKHEKKGGNWESAVKDAGKDSGWLLKKVISDDKRTFKTKKEELIRKYRWIANEE